MDKPTNGAGTESTKKICRNRQFIKINISTVKLLHNCLSHVQIHEIDSYA